MTSQDSLSLRECYRCTNCGKVTLFRKRICPSCGGRETVAVPSSGEGSVVDFVTVIVPPENYKDRAPYTSVLVNLDSGCRVFGILDQHVDELPLQAEVKVIHFDKDKGELIFALQ